MVTASAASAVCVDASLIVTFLLPDGPSDYVDALVSEWEPGDVRLIGPTLIHAEVPSAIRQAVARGRITIDQGDQAFAVFCNMSIEMVSNPDLYLLAWELAKRYNHPKTYDLNYVAAAQLKGCDLWTGDRRLVNSVGLPWVKWTGDHTQADTADEHA